MSFVDKFADIARENIRQEELKKQLVPIGEQITTRYDQTAGIPDKTEIIPFEQKTDGTFGPSNFLDLNDFFLNPWLWALIGGGFFLIILIAIIKKK